MRTFNLNKDAKYCPTVNIDKLWTLVPEETRSQLSGDKAPVIDCVRAVSLSSFCRIVCAKCGLFYSLMLRCRVHESMLSLSLLLKEKVGLSFSIFFL